MRLDSLSGPTTSPREAMIVATGLLVAMCIALAFRVPSLSEGDAVRPMHGDEANQAVKAGRLLDRGEYRYDPNEHHGPTLYYFALVSAWVGGHATFANTNEFTFRVVPVVFGIAIVPLLWLLRDGLGSGAVLASAMLVALSPAFVFYSRFFIQEMLLVCFTLASMATGWRYFRKPSWAWAAACGISLGLMHATKETCVIAFAALLVGVWITRSRRKKRGRHVFALFGAVDAKKGLLYDRAQKSTRSKTRLGQSLFCLGIAAAVSILFYSSFFTHARGPLDSILTYGAYLDRASGNTIHDKPWYYYLQLLSFVHRGPGPWWSEGFVLLFAIFGLGRIFFPGEKAQGHRRFLGLLSFYTLFTFAVYSAIPYKTPWSVLSAYLGAILLAGYGLQEAFIALRPLAARAALAACVAMGFGHLGYQAYQANFRYQADPVNPYVYAHTSSAFMRFAERVEDLAAAAPEGHDILIKVFQPDKDYWPIPWYLRRFPNAGYWHELPEDLDADVIVAAPELQSILDAGLKDEYAVEIHGLRPSVLRLVYIRQDLWDRFMETRR